MVDEVNFPLLAVAEAKEEATVAYACSHCSAKFSSRNQLFRHLKEVCDPSAAGARKRGDKERVILAIGYLGSNYHGSARCTEFDEASRPTVEGAIVAAIRRAWGGSVVNIVRSARTEKGCHACENVLAATVTGCTSDNLSAADLQHELLAAEIWLLAPPGPTSQPMFFDRLQSTKRRVYRCYIPYFALMNSEEQALQASKTPGYADVPSDGLWMCNLGEYSTPDDVATMLNEHVGKHGVKVSADDVTVIPGGLATVHIPAALVHVAVRHLNGLPSSSRDKLYAVPLAISHAKIAIGRRISTGMKVLRGPAKGVRSFHSFMLDVAPEDPAAMRMLTKCSARGLSYDVLGTQGAENGWWVDSDWTTVLIAGPDFAPQQVRRMVGALVTTVRGNEGEDYLRRCFHEHLPTIAAPAEAVSLDGVVFGHWICDWRKVAGVEAAKTEDVRLAVEARVTKEAMQPWTDFVKKLEDGATRSHLAKELTTAAVRGDVERLVAALEAGAKPDAADEYGRTAAYLAAEAGNAVALQALAEHKADLERAANGGTTPCLAAAAMGRTAALDMLRSIGADFKKRAFSGKAAADYISGNQAQKGLSLNDSCVGRAKTTVVVPFKEDYAGAGTAYVDDCFSEEFLERLQALKEALPIAAKEKASPTDRAYFADTEGWVTEHLNAAIQASGLPGVSEALPLMRFLIYPRPGGSLPAHVDLSRTHQGRRSTHSFLLYMEDCNDGGETVMLEALDGDSALAACGGVVPGARKTVASVAPRRGRLLLMPHQCPHAALPVVDAPKVLLRGEILPPAADPDSVSK